MTTFWNDLTLSVNFPATIHCEQKTPTQTCMTIRWEQVNCARPMLDIRWSRPLTDLQYVWHPNCAKNRSLRVDWQSPLSASLSNGAPVFCFFNEQGRSRLTVALSDPLTEIQHQYGVHEEDGTLLCCIHVPMDMVRSSSSYTLTLMRITEDMPYEAALQLVSRWWETDCGFTPMPVPDAARLPLYSTWYSFHQNTIADEMEAECALAVQDGFRTVIVDDGWQTSDCSRGYGYCGDWQVAPDKIPDMRAHVARIHALGMKFMLWYNVSFVGEYSSHWDEFKDKLLCREEISHAGVLDPRFPEVRAFLIDTYVRALKDWDLDGFKLDFIDSFRPSSRAPLPREGMDYPLVEDAVLRLMTDVRQALTAIKPDILLEFRQNYIGPGMRTFGNMFRVSDCPADWLSNRVGMVDLRLLSGDTAVHSDMLMWHEADTVENAARQLLNVLFTVPQISVHLEKLPASHHAMLRFYMNLMTRKRDLLRAPLQAEAPHMLYPVVRTRLEDEEAVAVYESSKLITPADVHFSYLFNATGCSELLLRGDNHACRWEAFDCMGQKAAQGDCAEGAFITLPVPSGGYVLLERLR